MLHELKQQKQSKVDALITECSVFFAFSTEQFEKNKTPLQDGDKYVSVGAGGYMPKSKVDQFVKGMDNIDKEYKLALKAKKLRKQNISYELHNHEAFYTGEIEDTLQALGEGYTAKEVWQVFHAESKKVNL